MTDYIVGCDNIVGGESDLIERVCKVFEEKGHTAQRLSVGPNFVQSSGLQSSSSGKVAVFIVGGSDIGTYVDFRDGLKNGYYHWKYAWFAFASWTATSWITGEDLKNKPLVRAHDDNFSSGSSIAPYIGKSADYFFQENKQYVNYVYGQTPEELAKKILAGGGDDSPDEGSSASTIKEAIKEVMSAWDGEVECYVRDMQMYIHKIKLPEQDCDLLLSEGLNIESKSISVKDYCPNNTNKLVVHWDNGDDIIIQDNNRIERFGEKVKEVDAIKRVLSNESEKQDGDSDEKSIEKGYEEVPAETYEEALEYARLEWNRCKREDCHEIELSTKGGSEWQQGKWVRTYIPSFDIDGYYYISRVSENIDSSSDWKASLTLVDYPPSFGEPKEEETEEEETETTTTESEVTLDATS